MEEALGVVEEEAENDTQSKRKKDLEKRLENYRGDGNVARRDRARNTKGYSEKDKADRVVDCNNGKKHIGQGTLCLILLYYHEGSGRGGSRRDSAEYDSGRERKDLLAEYEVKTDKKRVNNESCNDRLEDADDGSRLTYLFELRNAELITY